MKFQPRLARQSEVLAFVTDYCRENGRGPTIVELGIACGYKHPMGVQSMIARLIERGLLERAGPNRSLQPTGRCPCCGKRTED